MWGGRASPGAVLTVPPRSLLPRPRRLVGFSSCARDCGEFRARDFPALCGCWTTEPPCCQRYRARPPSPSNCSLGGSVANGKCPLSERGKSPQRWGVSSRQGGSVPSASGECPPPDKWGMSPSASGECPHRQRGNVLPSKRGMSPQHGGGAGGIPRSGGGMGCSAAISTFRRGTDRAFSQAGGDDPQTAESGGPGRPRSRGDRPRWSGRRGGVSHCPVPYAVTIKE